MSANPYENEPGFEDARSAEDKKMIAHYQAKIRHETLRISIIQRLEGYLGIQADGTVANSPPLDRPFSTDYDDHHDAGEPEFEPFKDLCKRRFLWYYPSYCLTIAEAEKTVRPDEKFVTMPFESTGNMMEGKFNYPELRRRLETIRKVLDQEVAYWAQEGMHQVRLPPSPYINLSNFSKVKKESSLATSWQRNFDHTVTILSKNPLVTLDLTLPHPSNPFIWQLTYFGRPMTHLDGGIFIFKIHISPRFPEELPRVIVETPLFHHRISEDGVLCYFPVKAGEMHSHVDAIIAAIEETDPPYDPRCLVNPEASRLFWGSKEDKKAYNRQLRRAVQKSTE